MLQVEIDFALGRQKGHPMTIVADNPIVHKLPNALREALLQAGLGNALLVVEGLYMLGIIADTWLLFDEIFTLWLEFNICAIRGN